ncbi:DUF397 domain-containing protein [Streptomyces venezuelae]|uniref:DUF397 domain-containing protein n=1 Tax=Streptomyces venezuelae TaxID=54571 RepID=A0A5P2CW31_STRVZ|nr:DUF397 domain-containing protein [Streptomyces venezuelae]QES47112.1 DUF397 domain-containing protein [Streptomyces venezuelae]
MRFENGVEADRIPSVRWVKSSASSGIGNCVEVAALPGGDFAVRNSRFPAGPALIFTRDEMTAFVAGAGAGEFDRLHEVSA